MSDDTPCTNKLRTRWDAKEQAAVEHLKKLKLTLSEGEALRLSFLDGWDAGRANAWNELSNHYNEELRERDEEVRRWQEAHKKLGDELITENKRLHQKTYDIDDLYKAALKREESLTEVRDALVKVNREVCAKRDQLREALEKIDALGESNCDIEGLGLDCEAWQIAHETLKLEGQE